jgi:hypothetical protein
MPTRRHLLAAAGVAVAGSGCMSALGDDPESANDAAAEADGAEGADAAAGEGVRIGKLSVRNNHEEAHQLQLAVESADGVLHMNTYELEAGAGTVVEGDWTSTAGAYIVHARLNDEEIRSTDVTGSVDDATECVQMVLRISAEGDFGVLYGTGCDR